MGTVIARGNYRVAVKGSRNAFVKKGKVYDEKDPVVKAHPGLFDKPDQAAKRQSPPTNTTDLGEKSTSARVRTRRQKPGEPVSEPKGDD